VATIASSSVAIDVTDDGVGLDRVAARQALGRGHVGLRSMDERAQLVGGDLRIENAGPAGASSLVELDRAHLERAFALDAAGALDAEAFGKRLESVLVGGDRVSIFAYRMAGQRKSKESRGRLPRRQGTWQDGGDPGRRAAEIEVANRDEGEAVQAASSPAASTLRGAHPP